MTRVPFAFVYLVVLAAGGCRMEVERSSDADDPTHAVTGPLVQNIRTGRVDRFDPSVDYFPEKAVVTRAGGLAVEYRGHYKLVTIDPDRTGRHRQQFALVQRGTPPPTDVPADHVIEVPVRRFAVLNFIWEALIDELDLEDRLVGVYSRQISTAPGIRKLIDENRLETLGCCSSVNVEFLAVTRPDVVLTSFTTPDPSAPLLAQAGVKVIPTATIWEPSILGRAEWSKLLGLLVNREADLEARFDRLAERYDALEARAAATSEKPLVLFGYPSRGRWIASWEFQRLVKDAGGVVFGPQQPEDVPVNVQMEISFEEALGRGRDAPVWVFLPDFVGSFDALLALEQRLASFKAVQTRSVYDICNKCVAGRDSPYWSEYLANPDTVLADLVHILHPAVLPGHTLVHMRRAPQSHRQVLHGQ